MNSLIPFVKYLMVASFSSDDGTIAPESWYELARINLVDGGYLSWIYGCKSGTQDEWETAAAWYSHVRGNLILMDSNLSFRKELDQHYKSRRRERRDADPVKDEQRTEVHRFVTEVMKPNPHLTMFEWPGLEADDLVALSVVMLARNSKDPLPIVGVDKDLLQLPTPFARMRRINDEAITIQNYARRLPKALQPYVRRGRDVLLCLALMGDKSDSVIRLIPSRDFRQMIELLHLPRPFRQAARWFGEKEVGLNTFLTVLPAPWCFKPTPAPIDVMNLLDDGSWWQYPNLPVDADLYHALWLTIMSVLGRPLIPGIPRRTGPKIVLEAEDW
jgi:hypothetical protein